MPDAANKKTLLAVLVAAFALQTGLVYSDERQEPLSEDALAGRELWHDNACQVCHQIYGQGGFLGPDLTNAASRVDDARLGLLLTKGSGQMPAFDLSQQEIGYVAAYLEALDRPDLGRGQLRLGASSEESGPWGRFGDVVSGALAGESQDVEEGYGVFRERSCTGCHLPLRPSPVGAPDLSVTQLTGQEIRGVLVNGRPGTIMVPPSPPFSDVELEAVTAFVRWLESSRSGLAATLEATETRSVDWSAIPWWEFR